MLQYDTASLLEIVNATAMAKLATENAMTFLNADNKRNLANALKQIQAKADAGEGVVYIPYPSVIAYHIENMVPAKDTLIAGLTARGFRIYDAAQHEKIGVEW